MSKKTIGIFAEGDNELQEWLMADEIMKEARKREYNTLMFHSLMKKPPHDKGILPDKVVKGESSIYMLPDYSVFDGVIILGETLRPDVTQEVIRRAKEASVPVININDTHEGCHNVVYDDVVGMKEMTLHLIRKHGCRTFYFISGFEGNKESMEREEAYKEALREENIPFDPKCIGYGEFHLKSAEVAEKYLQECHSLPDAFVCANDTMAMMVANYLIQKGYRVPEDVIVTGFDHLTEAAEYQPSITSVERSVCESGKIAVRLLEKIWAEEEVPEITSVPAHIVPGQSCGCIRKEMEKLHQINREKTNQIIDRDVFIHHISALWRDFESAESMKDMFDVICQNMDFFQWKKVNFCICEDIFSGQTVHESRYGYTQNMVIVKYRKGKAPVYENAFFENILPDFRKGQWTAVFIPMHIKSRTIGYLWIPAENGMTKLPMLYTFLTTINSAISDFCLINEKDALVKQLNNMYVRDELTRLYNRFGMQKYSQKLLQLAKESNGRIMCVAADLDYLKLINDTYGHSAGDNAIVQISNALKQAAGRQEICVRSGGDEFLVFGMVESEQDAISYIDRVESVLVQYNTLNQWPYTVAASCGYYVADARKVSSLEVLISEADKMLYQVKTVRKTHRID